MRRCGLLILSALAVACGDGARTLVVNVDSTQLVPSPDTLFLTLTHDTEQIAHDTPVQSSNHTRIAIVAGDRTASDLVLEVTAYAGATPVGQSPEQAVRLDEGAAEIDVVLE